MDNRRQMDRAYNIILTKMVETGKAPHYTEIASALAVSMEEGRQVLHELFSQSVMISTDLKINFLSFKCCKK